MKKYIIVTTILLCNIQALSHPVFASELQRHWFYTEDRDTTQNLQEPTIGNQDMTVSDDQTDLSDASDTEASEASADEDISADSEEISDDQEDSTDSEIYYGSEESDTSEVQESHEATTFEDLVVKLDSEYERVVKKGGYSYEVYGDNGTEPMVTIIFDTMLSYNWNTITDEEMQANIVKRTPFLDKMTEYVATMPEGDRKRFFSKARDTMASIVYGYE